MLDNTVAVVHLFHLVSFGQRQKLLLGLNKYERNHQILPRIRFFSFFFFFLIVLKNHWWRLWPPSHPPLSAGDLFTEAAEAAMEAMKGRLANQYYMKAEEAWALMEEE